MLPVVVTLVFAAAAAAAALSRVLTCGFETFGILLMVVNIPRGCG